jgi:hypothetical protein
VNQTSAIENAETSAIGRALAALGLHGGEYASANEIDIAEAKREHLKVVPKEPVKETVEVAIPTQAGDAVVEVPGKSGSEPLFVEVVKTFLPECSTVDDLMKFWTANSAAFADLKKSNEKSFNEIKELFTRREAELKEERLWLSKRGPTRAHCLPTTRRPATRPQTCAVTSSCRLNWSGIWPVWSTASSPQRCVSSRGARPQTTAISS